MAKSMKINFEPKEFSSKFKLAASVAATRDTKPILQNVMVKADKKTGVILQATDTELGIRIRVDCDVAANGEAILPAKKLPQILTETREERLTLEGGDSSIIVFGEHVKHDLNTQSPEEFPNVEEFEETAYHEIPAKALKEMIRRTTFATDAENARFALGGVCFEMVEDNVSVVATDGRRLAWQEGKGNCVNDHKVEAAILPARTLELLGQALGDKTIDEDDDVKVAISAHRVLFHCKNITLSSRLVEGRFPKWRTIIPQTDDEVPVTIESAALFSAIRQAGIATDDLEPGVNFTFEPGKLTLHGQGKEIGNSTVELPISHDGKEKTLKLNPKFMTGFLKVLDADQVVSIYLPPDNDPVKITADDGGYVYVVMPMSP